MDKIKDLNKLLIGHKIAHPKESLEEILYDIIINNKLDFYKKSNNFFDVKNININIKDIIKIIYNNWKTSLDDKEYFMFSNNYAIFIKRNNINIVGHISLEDIYNLDSPLINSLKDKEKKHAYIYQTNTPGTYEVDNEIVEVNERGKIKIKKDEVEYGIVDKKIKNKKEKVYFLTPEYLKGKKIEEKELETIIKELSKTYIKNININKVFAQNGFTILESIYQFLTNVNTITLEDSINGKLLKGRIDLSTDRGYETKPEMPQQDAILGIVKNENIFLNAIADGAGGSEKGEKASREVILGLKEWFEIMPEELFEDEEIIISLLKQKIIELDQTINKKYKESYTTIVLALTIYDKTILLNIGDSTAYTLEKGTLKLLTQTDSETSDLEYEDARFSIWNHIVTAAIGDGLNQEIHVNIIENEGQKIILSSDGVTDLISEERFKTYFKKDIKSSEIIKDALSKKDTEYLQKTEDNISVIIVKLPKKSKTKKLV